MRGKRAGGRASLREVAATAGVALSSASRALNGHPDVSDAMRRRVQAAAEQLGYEQNLLWEGIRDGQTHTVGIVVRDITSSLWSEIALTAELVLQRHGYSMLLSNSQGVPEFEVSQIRLLDQRRVDGFIVSPSDVSDPETAAALSRLRVPIVVIDRDLPAGVSASQVMIDQRAGVGEAVRHLIGLGHRHIGLIVPPHNFRPSAEAAAAAQEVCSAHGVALTVKAGPFSEAHGAAATRELLTAEPPATAIISGSGQIFPGVLAAARELGARIPGDFSMVAVEGLPLLSYLEPPMALVTRQPRRVGEVAADLLLDLMAGGTPGSRWVSTAFQPAASCAPPPVKAAK
ncbi:MAG TPA: LacI family DNA-binding transcriptional regulator [Baekduia sp.]|uniref:LacI family DNA-binding transcriptional regulator n=1 Tax=Baekduia sp. TaxID=2600305 RepID=UPI002D78EB19|nr:LacI family DNA-binding transcriptional regulator [Baekduia sp.]HET6509890.1 LacI family DNA-binding transcriptional regulator [Baekduia sp.]